MYYLYTVKGQFVHRHVFTDALQIEELTSNLPALQTLSNSASSVDSMANSESTSPPMKRKVITKFQGNAKKAMLRWVQCTATRYAYVYFIL